MMLKVLQRGYLGAAPELRFTPGGDAVATFRVCTTNRYTDKNTGEQKEQQVWLRWECWGKSAENLVKMLQKGSQVLLEGSIRNEKWQDKDGNDHYRDKYVVRTWEILDRKTQDEGPSVGEGGEAPANPPVLDDVPV